MGVPVEFCDREELDSSPVTRMKGFGSYPVPEGAWSDDTSMSLCALDVLAKNTVDYNAIMDNFARWCVSDEFTPTGSTFDIGGTCLAAIHSYLAPDCKPAIRCGQKNEYSNGNGSLMRIHPFVLYAYAKKMPYSEWGILIKNGSALTHAHPRSIVGCLIYSFVLIHLLTAPTKASVSLALGRAKCYLENNREFAHYGRLFRPDFKTLPREEIKSSGYIVDTLEAALWCLYNTESYEECVLKAVNLGEDTDTVAAVAGGLAGALYGYGAIPQKWLDTLIKRDYIESLCDSASENWIK